MRLVITAPNKIIEGEALLNHQLPNGGDVVIDSVCAAMLAINISTNRHLIYLIVNRSMR